LVQDALCGRESTPVSAGKAELLVVNPRHHRWVTTDVDARRHSDQHRLRPPGHARQIGDLHRRIHDDAPDADGSGVGQFIDRFRIAVQDDPPRIHTAGQSDRKLTGGADVEACALLNDPPGDVGGQQRLRGVENFDTP
jgi:hypothetical protein